MSDLQRLIDGFDSGELVRPRSDVAGLVDVARAVADSCGVPGTKLNDHSRAIASQIRRAEHLVLLLADGLGLNFIDMLPRDAWLRRHTQRSIQAPFPPTTTTAITSMATATYPAEHGVVGWWTYIPAISAPVTVFYHHRTQDEVSIEQLGAGIDDLCALEPVIPRMERDAAVVTPVGIVNSPFTRYLAGEASRIGYRTPAEAADQIVQRVRDAAGPTFTYWYTPRPDSLAHELGTRDPRVIDSVEELDQAVARLDAELAALPGSHRILATADHGHLDVGGAGHLEVPGGDPLLDRLCCHPSGDVRVQYWHVREGQSAAFEREFRDRFGQWFLLIAADEVDGLRIFGPHAMSAETRRRVGDYVSIGIGPEVLRYTGTPGRADYFAQRSHHSGLSHAEMEIPLIVGGSDDVSMHA